MSPRGLLLCVCVFTRVKKHKVAPHLCSLLTSLMVGVAWHRPACIYHRIPASLILLCSIAVNGKQVWLHMFCLFFLLIKGNQIQNVFHVFSTCDTLPLILFLISFKKKKGPNEFQTVVLIYFLLAVPNPKRHLWMFSHCLINNPELSYQRIFDISAY